MSKAITLVTLLLLMASGQAWSGAICVVALWKGSVLDYVYLAGDIHPHELQAQAEAMLAQRGYDDYDPGWISVMHAGKLI